MLIDFPEEKKKILRFFSKYIEYKKKETGAFVSQIPKVRIFEGDKCILVKEDGTEEEINYEKFKDKIVLDIQEIKNMLHNRDILGIFQKLLEALDKMAIRLIQKESQAFYKELDRVSRYAGMPIQGQTKPFLESFLEALEKIQIEFDEKGEPILPYIVIHPETAEKIRLKEQIEKAKSDSILRKRFNEIITKKKEEWRDREASRKLVG